MDCSRCPACGATELRIDPDASGYPCPDCDELNTEPAGACWNCEAWLEYQVRSIQFD